MNPTSRLLAVCASLGLAACAAPASVEGVFSGDGFRLDCETPLAKPTASGRDMLVVLAETDGETLRTVSVRLPRTADLPLGEPLAVGSGDGDDPRPSVDVVVGDLVVDTRSDGVQILSSENAVRAASAGGSLTLDERTGASADAPAELAGSFRVDLDDGGYLEGTFVAAPLD